MKTNKEIDAAMRDAWNVSTSKALADEANFLKYIIWYASALTGFSITIFSTVYRGTCIPAGELWQAWGISVATVITGIFYYKISKCANFVYCKNIQREIDGEDTKRNYYNIICDILEPILFILIITATFINLRLMINNF